MYIYADFFWSLFLLSVVPFNTFRPRQNGRHLADDIFKCIFLNKNASIAIKISLKFVPKGPINNIPSLVQIMAWYCPGDKPLSEPMMVSLPTHIYASLGLSELRVQLKGPMGCMYPGGGLALHMWQAITWSNDDPVLWHIITPVFLSELTLYVLYKHIFTLYVILPLW